VEMQLSMSLSGIPFSGSDAGGFGSDAEPENFIDWFKTMFLFPFLRNHSADGTVFQEPWAFDESTLDIVRGYIRARYALRPYLYQLFIRQEAEGDPIIRPLLYHYADCDTMDDQFLVGDAVLQAPKLEKGLTQRSVFIPPGEWYESRSGEWISGPCSIAAEFDACGTPLYIRSGSVIPMSRHADVGDPLTDIDVFLCSGYLQTGRGEGTVTLDAGEGFEYRKGEKTEIAVSFEWSAEKQLSVVVEVVNAGWRLPRIRLLFPNSIESAELTLKHADGKRERINCQLQAESLPLPGCGVNLFAADIVQV
jgi:alpha-glucosidase